MPRLLYSRDRNPVSIVQEAGRAPGLSGWVRKILPPTEFNPWTIQLTVSCHIDCANPAHIRFTGLGKIRWSRKVTQEKIKR